MEGAAATAASTVRSLGPPDQHWAPPSPGEPWRTPVDSVPASRNGAIPGWLASLVNPAVRFPPNRASVSGGVQDLYAPSGDARKSWSSTNSKDFRMAQTVHRAGPVTPRSQPV